MKQSIHKISNGYIVTYSDGKQEFVESFEQGIEGFGYMLTQYAEGKSIETVKQIINDCELGGNVTGLVIRIRECYDPTLRLKEAIDLVKLFTSIKNPAKSSP